MDWATNPIKLARARATVGATASEQELRAEYIRLGGGISAAYEEPTLVVEDKQEVVKEVKKKKESVVKKAIKKITKK